MSPSPPRLLVATSNRGKLHEVRALLEADGIVVVSLAEFAGIAEATEDGSTFEQNAVKKALHYHGQTGLTTLADDSGLEVDALGGAPGVHSARFAGAQGDDAANNARLVALLCGVPAERRTARFRCTMALVQDGAVVATSHGTVEGIIVDEPLGSNGAA
jgi:XTP/dITP diphosphohydrolase